jgi:hypothetical protein
VMRTISPRRSRAAALATPVPRCRAR